jgi:hypothetical protein
MISFQDEIVWKKKDVKIDFLYYLIRKKVEMFELEFGYVFFCYLIKQ